MKFLLKKHVGLIVECIMALVTLSLFLLCLDEVLEAILVLKKHVGLVVECVSSCNHVLVLCCLSEVLEAVVVLVLEMHVGLIVESIVALVTVSLFHVALLK